MPVKAVKFFKISLIILGVTFGLLILLPYVFKDNALAYLQSNASKKLKADVSFSDVHLSLIRSFPDLQIGIDSLKIIGRDTFEGIQLISAPNLEVDINILSLFGADKTPEISEIHASKPEIHIMILDSIRANYLIFPESEDTTTTTFTLAIQKYSLENATLTYQDNTLPMLVTLSGLDHQGKGDFTQDLFDLVTQTTAESFSLKYAGTTYIDQAIARLDAGISINVPEQSVTFRKNECTINAFRGSFGGTIQLKEEDILMNLQFETPMEDITSILSMVPGAFTKDFNQVKSSGQASFSGSLKGIYNGITGSMPGFFFQILAKDGSVQYPGMPRKLSNINVDMAIKADKADYSDLTIDVRKFSLSTGTESLSGRVYASNVMTDQKVEGDLMASLSLENLAGALPLPSISKMQGAINGELRFNASMDDVNNQRYDKIKFQGKMTAQNLYVKAREYPTVSAREFVLEASPALLSVHANELRLGESDLSIVARVENPLALFSAKSGPQVEVRATSSYFNADEWMPKGEISDEPQAAVSMPINSKVLETSRMTLDLNCKKAKFSGNEFRNIIVKGSLAANLLSMQEFSLYTGRSDLSASGQVANAWDYLFSGGTLQGNLNLQSDFLDLNPFMEAPSQASGAAKKTIPVPDRVRLHATASINRLLYTNMTLDKVSGALDVSDNQVALRDVKMNVLGGTMGMEGLYQTPLRLAPAFSIKLDLANMPFNKAFTTFESLAKFAPVAKHIEGIFNSTLVFSGSLSDQMMPMWQTINASGYLETIHGVIKGFAPFAQLSEKAGVKEVREIHLKNTRNWFDIVNGTVDMKEFHLQEKGIDMAIAGKLSLSRETDFTFVMAIPRELLKGNAVTAAANQALTRLEQEARKLGINLQQGPTINLKIGMSGIFPNLKWKITPLKYSGELSTTNEEATTGSIGDTLRRKLEEKGKEWKDTLVANAGKEAEKARQKAEQEARKVADSLSARAKREVGKQIDTLGKGVIPDTLRKKAKEILDKKTTEEVDKIKDKLKDFNPFKKKGNGL